MSGCRKRAKPAMMRRIATRLDRTCSSSGRLPRHLHKLTRGTVPTLYLRCRSSQSYASTDVDLLPESLERLKGLTQADVDGDRRRYKRMPSTRYIVAASNNRATVRGR